MCFCYYPYHLDTKEVKLDLSLAGIWVVNWVDKSRSTYTISKTESGLNMKVLWCSYTCVDTKGVPVEQPSLSVRYPASEGWLRVTNVHLTPGRIYFKKNDDGKIKVFWVSGNNPAFQGEGTKGIALLLLKGIFQKGKSD